MLAATFTVSMAATAQTLTVEPFEQVAGEEALIPVHLSANGTSIVGAQFDITLPYKKSSSSVVLAENRKNGHSVSIRRLNDLKYTVVIMSLNNNALKGNDGLLLTFPVLVDAKAQIGDTKTTKLENIVLTTINGQNVATQTTSEATFTVAYEPTPDLTVQALTISSNTTTLAPGGKMTVSFNVVNQGTAETGDGWTENVWLKDQGGHRTLVATKNYDATLDKASSVSRLYEVDLPQAMKMEGTVSAEVEIKDKDNTGEQVADQVNNSATSGNTMTLQKRLFLEFSNMVVEEGYGQSVTLIRSGNTTASETFTVTESSGLNMLELPSTVTIGASWSSVQFIVRAHDNSEVNPQYRTSLTVSGNDYEQAVMTVDVKDNDVKSLTLSTDKPRYKEGDELTLTVTIGKAASDDLTVNISNTDAGRFYPYIRSITIPAGQKSASKTTQVVNDDWPMADATVVFTATASGYATAQRPIGIEDDDWPTLTMTLTPNVISEGDGYGATMATISREGNIAQNLIVYLTASDNELYFDSQKVIIPAGQRSVEVPISIKDNALVGGERRHAITATACDATTGSTAGSQSSCTALLTVTDDDAALTLKLQSAVATLQEGGSTATVTISRNTTAGAISVGLTTDDEQLELPATVTIADGQSQATFTVRAGQNSVENDNHYTTVYATAEGYQRASFVFMVSDQTLPDAVCAAPVLTTAAPNFSGQTVSGTIAVSNQGLATLPAGMTIDLLMSSDQSIRISNYYTSPMQTLATVTTTAPIPVGESIDVPFEVTLPDSRIGVFYLFAWANKQGKTDESNNQNGRSTTTGLNIQAPFTQASLATDKVNYSQGERISISGQMSNADSGQPMDGRTIEIYVLGSADRLVTLMEATLDTEGRFTATYDIGTLAGGTYAIGARSKGTAAKDSETRINVTGMKMGSSYLKLTLTEGVVTEGDLTVTNQSGDGALHDLSFTLADMPEDWTVELSGVGTLNAGHTANVHYRIVPKTATDGSSYVRTQLTAVGHDSEGEVVATAGMTVDYFAKAAKCRLTTSGDAGIKTTLSKTTERTLMLTVKNTGLKETGLINVACAENQSWLRTAVGTLSSIEPGGSTQIALTLAGNENMIVDGSYKGYVKLKPANGTGIVVNIEARLVSTDTGRLTVDVVDAFTLEDETTDGPHVSGASVRLTNSLTGEVTMTGTTGADGRFTTDILKEGTYYVYVTAPNHNYAEKTITVNAGQENELQVYLPYKAVKVTYTVEETTVVDEYRTVISMEVVPDIPQAIVTPTLPENWGCGTQSYSIRLTNRGRLTAYNPYLEFPNIEGYTFTVKSDYPQTLYPNESYDVTVEFQGTDEQMISSIGAIVMHYGYKLRGEMYYGSETYAAQVGCKDIPLIIPCGGLGDYESANYGGVKITDPRLDQIGEEKDELGDIDMPSITYRDYTNTQTSSVTLQFEQKFFLERQAFKGHLTVENLQMNGIRDITLTPTVKRTDGTDASDLFAISFKGLGLWSGQDEWELAANTTGEATVLYVPSKETALTAKTDYLFGGTLTYRDIETGQFIKVELMQTKLTVNPSPDLHLTYFIQRDIVGDDPTTEEEEPWEPAEFALLIQNKGAGDAIDLKIETSEPVIVDNQANLPVEFTQLYTTVDGVEGTMSFNNLNLGRISAGQNIMARWWFASNVSAHVASYEARMTKHSNYGIEFDLITLDGIYELTRSVKGSVTDVAGARSMAPSTADVSGGSTSGRLQGKNIFLLNKVADEANLPDYVADDKGGGTDDLEIVSDKASITADGDMSYRLTITATRSGWVYGAIDDPKSDKQLATAIRDSDGQDVSSNVWQTVDGMLHFADNTGTEESYTLTYTEKAAAAPRVATIELTADKGADEATATKARVTFAEAIDGTTFTADDVMLVSGDQRVDVTVTPVADSEGTAFVIDWSTSRPVSGSTSLTVYTAGVSNTEGTAGRTSKTKTWDAILMGDVNGNGRVDIGDAVTIVNRLVGKTSETFVEKASDTNKNGGLDIGDAVTIVNFLVGKTTRL